MNLEEIAQDLIFTLIVDRPHNTLETLAQELKKEPTITKAEYSVSLGPEIILLTLATGVVAGLLSSLLYDALKKGAPHVKALIGKVLRKGKQHSTTGQAYLKLEYEAFTGKITSEGDFEVTFMKLKDYFN